MNKTTLLFLLLLSSLTSVFSAGNAEALCVKEKRANLRQGPGLHFEKLWEVYKYMPFKKLDEKGSWLRIQDMDGDIYWIFKKLVTGAYKCAVAKQNKTNFRKGPGTNHAKVPWSPVDKYFSMKVLEEKNNWVKIEAEDGDIAWIYRPLVWIQ